MGGEAEDFEDDDWALELQAALSILSGLRDQGPSASIEVDPRVLSSEPGVPVTARERTLRQLVEEGYLAEHREAPSHYVLSSSGREQLARWEESIRQLAAAASSSYQPHFSKDLITSIRTSITPDFSGVIASVLRNESISKQIGKIPSVRLPNLNPHLQVEMSRITREITKAISVKLSGLDLSLLKMLGWAVVIGDREKPEVVNFLVETGVPLLGATPPSVCVQLLDAEHERREDLFRTSEAAILLQCRDVLDHPREEHASWYQLLGASLEVFTNGGHEAAQALATVVLDRMVHDLVQDVIESGLFPREAATADGAYEKTVKALLVEVNPKQLRSRYTGPHERYEEFSARWLLTLPVLLSAYRKYWPDRPQAPPANFSRHVTVHSGMAQHFTRENALRAIMTAVSLLWLRHPTVALEGRPDRA